MNKKSSRGFTIVELLVVIVVIGILAAITIVSYSGITAKANKASEQSAAASLQGKVEAYLADPTGTTGYYPLTIAVLTAGGTNTWAISSSAVTYSALGSAPSAPMNKVNYILCGKGAADPTPPANHAAITIPTGYKIGYWDGSSANITDYVGGTISGTGIACFTSGS